MNKYSPYKIFSHSEKLQSIRQGTLISIRCVLSLSIIVITTAFASTPAAPGVKRCQKVWPTISARECMKISLYLMQFRVTVSLRSSMNS